LTSRDGYIISDQYACYFVTFTVVEWIDLFTRKECQEILIEALRFCIEKKGLILYSYVIMSNHIHLIVSANEQSSGLSAIVRDYKKYTSKKLIKWVLQNPKESRKAWILKIFNSYGIKNSKNKCYQLWQQKNHPKLILYPNFMRRKINYIHNNPVVSGLVDDAEAYRLSSARNYAGRSDHILDVEIVHYGSEEGLLYFK